jgi:hypothetical protein
MIGQTIGSVTLFLRNSRRKTAHTFPGIARMGPVMQAAKQQYRARHSVACGISFARVGYH